MPTYDYKCPVCDHVQEEFHSMSKNPKIRCAECSSVMEKQIGAGGGVIFRGPGFYHTDYRLSEQNSANARRVPGRSKHGGKISKEDQ